RLAVNEPNQGEISVVAEPEFSVRAHVKCVAVHDRRDIGTDERCIVEDAVSTVVQAHEARPSELRAAQDTFVEIAHPDPSIYRRLPVQDAVPRVERAYVPAAVVVHVSV